MRRPTIVITNRNLGPGTKLIATYKKETYRALVVAGEGGKALYQLVPYDGKEYKNPSARCTAVTSRACNGWTFWNVDTSSPEATGEAATDQEPQTQEESTPEEQEPEEGNPSEDSTEQPATAGSAGSPNSGASPREK